MKNIPAPILIAMASTLYGLHTVFVILSNAGEWPIIYGGIAGTGMGSTLLISGLFIQRNQGINWKALFSKETNWTAYYLIMASRASLPTYIIAAAYIHFVIATVIASMMPTIMIAATWFQRRSSELKLPANISTILACAIGLVGGLMCAFAQPAPENNESFYILAHPTKTTLGISFAVVAMILAAGQAYIFKFWTDNEQRLLSAIPDVYGIDERAINVTTLGIMAMGAAALSVGLLFMTAGFIIGQTPQDQTYYLYPYINGLIAGSGTILWIAGFSKSRTLASNIVMYFEPVSSLVSTRILGLADELNWTLLSTSTTLIVGVGIVATVMEHKQKARENKKPITKQSRHRQATC